MIYYERIDPHHARVGDVIYKLPAPVEWDAETEAFLDSLGVAIQSTVELSDYLSKAIELVKSGAQILCNLGWVPVKSTEPQAGVV
jgi:hypothetical protein